MQRHVDGDDRLSQWLTAGQVEHSAEGRCDREPQARDDVRVWERTSTNAHAHTARYAASRWNGNLDRIAGR